jgi:hypothetical protein
MANTQALLKSLADAAGNFTHISFNLARASIAGVEARSSAGALHCGGRNQRLNL